jgi:hypothetical protein
MNDDWRLRVRFHEGGLAHALSKRLDAAEVEHDLEDSFHDRITVSVDHGEVFCYAGTREQAERAEQAIRRMATEKDWKIETELKHWHPSAEAWEDPDTPLPENDAQRIAEHAEMVAAERAEVSEQGYPDWEVRVRCPSHHEKDALAERLRAEGLPTVERWHSVLIGASDEEAAKALAERLRAEAPAGSEITIGASAQALRAETPGNPFAILGGLGG